MKRLMVLFSLILIVCFSLPALPSHAGVKDGFVFTGKLLFAPEFSVDQNAYEQHLINELSQHWRTSYIANYTVEPARFKYSITVVMWIDPMRKNMYVKRRITVKVDVMPGMSKPIPLPANEVVHIAVRTLDTNSKKSIRVETSFFPEMIVLDDMGNLETLNRSMFHSLTYQASEVLVWNPWQQPGTFFYTEKEWTDMPPVGRIDKKGNIHLEYLLSLKKERKNIELSPGGQAWIKLPVGRHRFSGLNVRVIQVNGDGRLYDHAGNTLYECPQIQSPGPNALSVLAQPVPGPWVRWVK